MHRGISSFAAFITTVVCGSCCSVVCMYVVVVVVVLVYTFTLPESEITTGHCPFSEEFWENSCTILNMLGHSLHAVYIDQQ